MLSKNQNRVKKHEKKAQWWSTILTISTKLTTSSVSLQIELKTDRICEWKSSSRLRTGKQCDWVKPINGTPSFYLDLQRLFRHKQTIKKPAAPYLEKSISSVDTKPTNDCFVLHCKLSDLVTIPIIYKLTIVTLI